jgi:hypothetical protein
VIINRPIASSDAAATRIGSPDPGLVPVDDEPPVASPTPAGSGGGSLRAVKEPETAVMGPKQPVVVQGVYCKDGHFNHPDAQFCRVDGLAMLNITRKLARGPRPSLGRLDFDDGAAYELDCDYVLGVEPALHQLVREGKAEPIVLRDTQNLISRRHAAIRLEGWDVRVVDLGSRNYTFVRIPPANDPMRLKTDESAVLKPGARVTIGDRSFVFFSHHQLT